jgi:hypothetical protein
MGAVQCVVKTHYTNGELRKRRDMHTYLIVFLIEPHFPRRRVSSHGMALLAGAAVQPRRFTDFLDAWRSLGARLSTTTLISEQADQKTGRRA